MSGKVLLDNNAIIYALNDGIVLPEGNYAISIITEMELLFSNDKQLSKIKKLKVISFQDFL